MPAAARGRFEPPGKRLQLFRQYNVSVDTGAFEICRSRPRAPDVSSLQSVEVRPARAGTCTHSPYHAYPCVHFLCGGVLVPALPSPSPPVHAPCHMHALRRCVKAGACAHESACAQMRTRTENARSTRLIRSDGCAVCTCTYREHAACIRRYFAGANDSAGVRMHNRAHTACAARFRTVVVTLASRVVSKMCAMAKMVLILSCSCHAIRRRAHELSARAAGATACMRVRVWPHGAPAFA